MSKYADDFSGIPAALAQNESLRNRVSDLARTEPMPGKVTEGEGRLEALRATLLDFIVGKLSLVDTIAEIERRLSRDQSSYAHDNRVFAKGWPDRLARTQISRLYNQAVLSALKSAGEDECFVPHSAAEAEDTPCSLHLAGNKQNVSLLLERLIRAYRDGDFRDELKIPNHPHCTHVVRPI